MNIKAFFAASAALFVAAGMSQEKPPIVRMDLLPKKDRPAMIVRRDIFLPQAAGPGAGFDFEDLRGLIPGAKPRPESVKSPEPPAEAAFSLRYIGYVRGKEKTTALILFEGQVLAVSEGDTVGAGWTVEKITTTEIEIVGSDGTRQKFSLEGVQP